MLAERLATRVLPGLSVVAICFRLWQALGRAVIPYQVDYAEGTILAGAVRLLHGEALYPTPGPLPYVLSPYGPVGYLLTALATKVWGLSLLGPRLLSVAAALAIALLIAGVSRAVGGTRAAGVLCAAAFFCSPLIWIWLPLLRVDFPAVMLSIAGLYVFARRGRLSLVSMLFVAAVFTKQTCVAALVACSVELALERRWRDLAVLLGWTCSLGLAVAAALGPNGLFHLISTHHDAFEAGRYLHNGAIALGGSFALLFAVGYGLATGCRPWTTGRVAWLYLGASTLVTLTAGKTGAETNHFIEWVAALAIVGAVSMSCGIRQGREAMPVAAAALAMIVVTVGGAWWRPRHDVNVQGCRDGYDYLRRSPGERVLSEDVSALLLTGKPVLASDPFAYQQVTGVAWEHGGLEQLVAAGYFDLVLVGDESFQAGHRPVRWSPELSRQVLTRYQPVQTFNCSPMLGVAYVRRESMNTALVRTP
jgi:hypothetical protein